MPGKKEIECGLDNIHVWIHFAGASGVPETILWEWLFHTKSEEGPNIGANIMTKVDDLLRSDRLIVQQIFDMATESISQDSAYEAGDPSMVDHVREYGNQRLSKNVDRRKGLQTRLLSF
ncbi:hypothetical protein [Desulfoscipio sp. XC116]|uniref:hypothetical protein n=1 Tax=Desulfoscipio sp. XC116 TaxID=3144975 RepID=UPI00325B20D0